MSVWAYYNYLYLLALILIDHKHLKNLQFLLGFLEFKFSKYPLMSFCISLDSLIRTPFSSLILMLCVFFLFLDRLANVCQTCELLQRTNSCLVDFWWCCFSLCFIISSLICYFLSSSGLGAAFLLPLKSLELYH